MSSILSPPRRGETYLRIDRFPQKITAIKQRLRSAKFQEHFKQAQLFYNSLSDVEKAHVLAAYSFELSHCDDPVVYESWTRLLNNVDFDLAKQVAINVGGVVPDKPVRPNPGHKTIRLSQLDFMPKEPTIKSRRIAILVADGFNLGEVQAIRAALKAGMASTWIIGPRRGPVYPDGEEVGRGKGYSADHHYESQRSTLFDAVIIPGGAKHAQALANNGRTVHWVREAFGHLKPIGALGEGEYARQSKQSLDADVTLHAGVAFLREAVGLPGVQFAADLNSDNVTVSYGVVTAGKYDLGSAAADVLEIKQGEKGFISNFAYELSKHRCWERELHGLNVKVPY